MRKWTHNRTGGDYWELGRGPMVATGVRLNDYDFVVGYLKPDGSIDILPQPTDNGVPEEYRGCTIYFGQVQSADPIEEGTMLVVYRSETTGKIWFRPEREWTPDRFTAILELGT